MHTNPYYSAVEKFLTSCTDVCIHTDEYIHIYTYIHTYIHTHTRLRRLSMQLVGNRTDTHTHMYAYTYMSTNMHI